MSGSGETGYMAALRGDFASADSGDGLMNMLIRTMGRAAGLDLAPVSPSDIHGHEVDEIVALIVHQEIRAHAIQLHTQDLGGWRNLLEACESASLSSRGHHATRCARAWATLDIQQVPSLTSLAELEASARRDGLAEFVLEAAALTALVQARTDINDAMRTARRASRMARTEAFPQLEYLVNATLAHMRRLAGRPFLAARIATTLRAVCSPSWKSWLDWEIFAAGIIPSWSGLSSPLAKAASEFVEECFDVNVPHPGHALSTFIGDRLSFLGEDLSLLTVGIDADADTSDDWFIGATDDLPGSIVGFAAYRGHAPETESALAYVRVTSSGRARRVLPLGFARAQSMVEVVLEQGQRKEARLASLAAALALAGKGGLADSECFERVYGFPYAAGPHRDAFKVLVHRTRTYLEPVGIIERSDGRIRLLNRVSFLVPDPRCTQRSKDRVLKVLAARNTGLTARETAALANVSLRLAQASLRELVDDEICELDRVGREVRYAIVDTTFRRPTYAG